MTLLGISGPGGQDLADRIEERLGEDFQTVDASVYRTMAEMIGRRGASPAEVSAVTWRLGLDVVVAGAVKVERGRHLLRITVRDGNAGDVIDRFDEPLGRDDSLSVAAEDRVLQRIAEGIEDADGVPRQARNSNRARAALDSRPPPTAAAAPVPAPRPVLLARSTPAPRAPAPSRAAAPPPPPPAPVRAAPILEELDDEPAPLRPTAVGRAAERARRSAEED